MVTPGRRNGANPAVGGVERFDRVWVVDSDSFVRLDNRAATVAVNPFERVAGASQSAGPGVHTVSPDTSEPSGNGEIPAAGVNGVIHHNNVPQRIFCFSDLTGNP
jgi:hypothetical protein